MIGQTLGHYRILEKIGGGGMGVVYRAHDDRLERDVAIKVLPPGTLGDEAARKRFRTEALALSKLNHPNIATVHDFDSVDGTDFIVMELVKGQTLSDTVRSNPMPEQDVLTAAIQIGQALEEAHEHGVIHRDLKSANVMLTLKGQVKVLDFGLAKYNPTLADGGATASLSQEHVVGTLPYMSPEQLRGQKVDERSDIYALGAVLYETSTGQRPFDDKLPTALADDILHQPPPPPGRLNPKISARLEVIILKCLEKAPEDRYQSSKELQVDLRRLKRDSESSSVSFASSKSAAPRAWRKPWLAWFAMGGALLAVLIAFNVWHRNSSRPNAHSDKQTAVAVLPFQNTGADNSHDFLRFAMPDEVVNTLSHIPALAIRPFSITRKYTDEKTDPLAVGRDLGVADIITGNYSLEGGQLHVTVEAIDLASNSLIWHKSVSAPAGDSIPLRDQLSAQISKELLPALGVSAASATSSASQPKNVQAYDLYQRSLGISHTVAGNPDGIALLEKSVELDSQYAPAWLELGGRLYEHAEFASGGEAELSRSTDAYQRALAIDPDLLEATSSIIARHVEQGRFETAFDEADGMVKRHPQSAVAHYTLVEVLRYGGMLEESAHECEIASRLDPSDDSKVACSITYRLLGQYDRASDVLHVHSDNDFVGLMAASNYLGQGMAEKAYAVAPKTARFMPMVQACIEKQPLPKIIELANQLSESVLTVSDSEPKYFVGAWEAYCGAHQNALRLLKTAVDQGYCAALAADKDPPYKSIRETPEFKEIYRSAIACRDKFAAHRAQVLR